MLLDIIRFFTFASEIRRCFLECGPYFANINLSVKWATYRTCTHPVSIGRKQDLQYCTCGKPFSSLEQMFPPVKSMIFLVIWCWTKVHYLMLDGEQRYCTLFDAEWCTRTVRCWTEVHYLMLNRGTLLYLMLNRGTLFEVRWWTEVLYNVHCLMLNDVLVRCWTEVHYLKLL